MKRYFNLSLFLLLLPVSIMAQADDDIFEANRLKKTFPDDRVVATIVEEEFNFDKGRSDDKLPVVTATKNTGITFLALRERASIQYYDFYNSFCKITSFKCFDTSYKCFSMLCHELNLTTNTLNVSFRSYS